MLLSVVLTVVADRFFCPALEVLSDYFQLPANVAGATLLSFGNGAPDVFTQLAAVATVRTRPVRSSSRALEAGAFARSFPNQALNAFVPNLQPSASASAHAKLFNRSERANLFTSPAQIISRSD